MKSHTVELTASERALLLALLDTYRQSLELLHARVGANIAADWNASIVLKRKLEGDL